MRKVYFGMNAEDINGEHLNGVYREIAELLGTEAAITLYSAYRGQQITFPVNLFTHGFIAKQIVSEYNGSNIRKLATKYGYSEKWIRKIIKENSN